MHFSLTYRCQKSRTETKNSLLVWHQICAAVQLSQHSPCSLWLPSTPAAALQVSSWHTAALDVFLLSFTTELFFSSASLTVSSSRTGMSVPGHGTSPSSQRLTVSTLTGRILKTSSCVQAHPGLIKANKNPQAEKKTTFCHCWHTDQKWTISCCSFSLFFTIAAVSSRRERQRARAMASTHRHSC